MGYQELQAATSSSTGLLRGDINKRRKILSMKLFVPDSLKFSFHVQARTAKSSQ